MHSSFDSDANVTLYSLPWLGTPAIFEDGSVCPDCVVNSFTGGALSFNVTHFSNYSAGANANLSIWDGSDSLGMCIDENITFIANYTVIASGAPITGPDVSCRVMYNVTPYGPYEMYWNSTSGEYNHNRTFSSAGVYEWNVTCNNSQGYENLTTQDTVYVQDIEAIEVTLNSPSDSNHSVDMSTVMFNCSVTGSKLVNTTLWSDYPGSWQEIETISVSSPSDYAEFTKDIYSARGEFIDSQFRWNCYACNNSDGCVWAASNYTFSGWDRGTYNKSFFNTSDSFIGLTENDSDQELPDSGDDDGYIAVSYTHLTLPTN